MASLELFLAFDSLSQIYAHSTLDFPFFLLPLWMEKWHCSHISTNFIKNFPLDSRTCVQFHFALLIIVPVPTFSCWSHILCSCTSPSLPITPIAICVCFIHPKEDKVKCLILPANFHFTFHSNPIYSGRLVLVVLFISLLHSKECNFSVRFRFSVLLEVDIVSSLCVLISLTGNMLPQCLSNRCLFTRPASTEDHILDTVSPMSNVLVLHSVFADIKGWYHPGAGSVVQLQHLVGQVACYPGQHHHLVLF